MKWNEFIKRLQLFIVPYAFYTASKLVTRSHTKIHIFTIFPVAVSIIYFYTFHFGLSLLFPFIGP